MYYLYHTEKSGGRSIIHSFLHSVMDEGLVFDDKENLSDLYRELCGKRRDFGNKYFHAWQGVIKKCKHNSLFGFSHLPYNEVVTPKGTFKIAIIREPLERLLSHYRMLVRFGKENKGYETKSDTPAYIKNGFNSFIEVFPERFMQHQLWFWSNTFNIKEAISNIKKCNVIISTERMSEGIDKINKISGLELKCFHAGVGNKEPILTDKQTGILKQRLSKEYQFYESMWD